MESHFHLCNDCAHSRFGRERGGRNCFNLAAVQPLVGFFLLGNTWISCQTNLIAVISCLPLFLHLNVKKKKPHWKVNPLYLQNWSVLKLTGYVCVLCICEEENFRYFCVQLKTNMTVPAQNECFPRKKMVQKLDLRYTGKGGKGSSLCNHVLFLWELHSAHASSRAFLKRSLRSEFKVLTKANTQALNSVLLIRYTKMFLVYEGIRCKSHKSYFITSL